MASTAVRTSFACLRTSSTLPRALSSRPVAPLRWKAQFKPRFGDVRCFQLATEPPEAQAKIAPLMPTVSRGATKLFKSADDAVADLKSGSTILSSGFGLCGTAGKNKI